jgi:hypothetical protein
LFEIGDEIVGIFEADAQAKKSVGHSGRRASRGREVGVRRVAGFAHYGIDSAEAWRVSPELKPSYHTVRGGAASGQLESQHPAETILLLASDRVIGVVG